MISKIVWFVEERARELLTHPLLDWHKVRLDDPRVERVRQDLAMGFQQRSVRDRA